MLYLQFGSSLLAEEETESSMAEASNPMFDPMHRARTQPVPVPMNGRHQRRHQDQNRNRQQRQAKQLQQKKQAQREQRPYDEDYARLEEGMGKISGDGDAPVSPPRGHGSGPKHRVHVKVYRFGIPPRSEDSGG